MAGAEGLDQALIWDLPPELFSQPPLVSSGALTFGIFGTMYAEQRHGIQLMRPSKFFKVLVLFSCVLLSYC